jgi:type III restriction enzyme
VDKIEPLRIDPKLEPTTTFLRPTAGYMDSHQAGAVPFEFVKQERDSYYRQVHFQSILFQITQMVIDDLLAPTMARSGKKERVFRLRSRHQLFPQVFAIVQACVRRKVDFNGVDPRELGLEKYTRLAVERVRDAVHPDDSQGEPPLLPILNRYRPVGSTSGVDFIRTRTAVKTEKSHINAVVLHSGWEADAARLLDACDFVKWHARNDHLGLVIPYEFMGVSHDYEPDFLVRLVNDLTLLLEIKGYEVHNAQFPLEILRG